MRPPIDPSVRNEIERRLGAIEAAEGVRFLLAIESGSRAWGFPSPDSDYDVRFIYVRPRDWYLSLDPGRDVIEQPITDDIDLNGWDVRKALSLLLKSNAVVNEWLASPIRYRPDDPSVEGLSQLLARTFNPRGFAQHYANLGKNAADRWLVGDGEVAVKRYFYALRPALAIRALRFEPSKPPAMNLQQLMADARLSDGIVDGIDNLVEAKSRTRELGNACRVPELDDLIRDELSRAAEVPERSGTEGDRKATNQYFLELLNT